jgi:anti-sigma B factor antagonist
MVTVEHADGCATVSPHGEIDIATAPQLQDAIVEALGSGASALVIDLADVQFLDSSAIQIFSKAAKQLWDAGHTFALASPTPEARRVLDLVGLSAKFGL